nr:zinc-finger domain-containing protein [Heyndrickxia ginsengihumi]
MFFKNLFSQRVWKKNAHQFCIRKCSVGEN